jgi:PilZ domain-containing protein
MHLTASLQSRGEPPIVETVMIVNISSHGARVLAHRYWRPHEQLVLTEFVGGFHVDAEVVYCQRLDRNQCAVGLRFATPVDSAWPAAGGSFGMRSRASS